MRTKICEGCGEPLVPKGGRGRPRKTCDEECARTVKRRKATQRAAKDAITAVGARKDAVWADLELRAQWDLAIRQNEKVIAGVIWHFKSWNHLPPEMTGPSYGVISGTETRAGRPGDVPGVKGNVLTAQSPLLGYAWEAIGDLIFVHRRARALSPGMVSNRIKQHIMDQIRKQPGWGQPRVEEPARWIEPTTVTNPDGSTTVVPRYEMPAKVRRPTRPLHLPVDPPRVGPNEPDDIVGDRVETLAAHEEGLRHLDGLDQAVAVVHEWAMRSVSELKVILSSSEAAEKLASYDDPLEAVAWLFGSPVYEGGPWWWHFSEEEVQDALTRAFEVVGDLEATEEFYGAGEEIPVPDKELAG